MEIVKRGLRGGALVLLALVVAFAASAQPPGAAKVPTLKARVASTTKQKEELVAKFLEALGPAMREQLAAGKSVALPGVGVFNVVRVAEHRNLVEGRVVVVRATNYIEFVPAGIMVDTANSAGAQPVRTVPGFEYNPNPRMEPSLRTDGLKVGRTRTR